MWQYTSKLYSTDYVVFLIFLFMLSLLMDDLFNKRSDLILIGSDKKQMFLLFSKKKLQSKKK